jgi:hypothetical protein
MPGYVPFSEDGDYVMTPEEELFIEAKAQKNHIKVIPCLRRRSHV